MTEKRFTEIVSTQKVIDNQTGREYYCLIDDELLDLLNELAEENKQLCNDCSILVQSNQEYRTKNKELEERNKSLASELDSKQRVIDSCDDFISELKKDGVLDD